MALGTPVAAAAAYSAASGTSVSPAYPAGILATDAVVLFVGMKPTAVAGGTVTTPTGWTLQDSLTNAGGYAAQGADTGNSNLYVYTWNTPVAGQTGNLAVTIGGNNVTWAFIVRVPAGGGALSYGSADGQRTTTPTSPMSIALANGATATNFQNGDLALWAMCVPTDVTTPAQFSAQSITATGTTFGTAAELNEPDSQTGNDIGGYSAWASVTAGSSTTAPTVTATLAGTLTNVRGPVVLLRVREAALSPVTGDLDATETGADAFAADGGPVVQGSLSASEAGEDSFSASGTVSDATITGDLSATEAGEDSFSASGTVTDPAITGALSATEAGTDTLAATGKVIAQGSLSVAEIGADALSASGSVLVQGSLLPTEAGADTLSSSGGVASSGALTATESGTDTLSASGVVLVQGLLSATETAADQFSASGASLTSGSLAATETEKDTLSSEGAIKVQGSLSVGETGLDTFAALASAVSPVTGSAYILESGPKTLDLSFADGVFEVYVEDRDTALITGGPIIAAALNAQESGEDQFSGSGINIISGSADLIDSLPDSAFAQGGVLISGSASVTELGVNATLDLSFTSGAYQTTVLDTMQAAGVIPSVGSFAASEADLDTFAASGGRLSSGDLAATDEPDTAAGSGRVIVSGYGAAYEAGADSLSSPSGYWEHYTEAGYAVNDEVGRVRVQGVGSLLEVLEDSASSAGQILIAGNAGITESSVDTMAGGIVIGFASAGRTQSVVDLEQSRPSEFEHSREYFVSPSRSEDSSTRPTTYSARR